MILDCPNPTRIEKMNKIIKHPAFFQFLIMSDDNFRVRTQKDAKTQYFVSRTKPIFIRTKPIFCYNKKTVFGTHILKRIKPIINPYKPVLKICFLASESLRLRRRVLRLCLSFCKIQSAIARSRQKEHNADYRSYCQFTGFISENLTFEMPCISIVTFCLPPVPLKEKFTA